MKKKPKLGNRNHQLWNSRNLLPPSLEFFVSKKRIHRTVRKAIVVEYKANKYRESLFTEAITLSRFMDDRKNKYRTDKGFRSIRKINKVVERIHEIDLKSAVVVIKSNLTERFVPSKQLCRWMLVKLQSNVLLLHSLEEYCEYAASKLHLRLKTGHNWVEVTMALSMISRIWALSKLLLKISFLSYKKLISVSDNLTTSSEEMQWLRLKFPLNLRKWVLRKSKQEP